MSHIVDQYWLVHHWCNSNDFPSWIWVQYKTNPCANDSRWRGILFSILGIFTVKTKKDANQKQLLTSLHTGTNVAAGLTLAFIAFLASQGLHHMGNLWVRNCRINIWRSHWSSDRILYV